MRTRRETLLGALALGACAPVAAPPDGEYPARDDPRFAAVEARIGGRVGVAAINTASGEWLTHRAQERFALCSTFKWMLAAQMLQLAERQPDLLAERVLFNEEHLLSYAPVTRERFQERANGMPWAYMTIGELAEAATVMSDNTAANLLLEGAAMEPSGFTHFLRANGDAVTRLDRYEIELNDVPPGDERDTTTPDAMARSLRRFALGHVELGSPPLNQRSREQLIAWLVASPTGRERLRAGLPADWRVGDKTGTWTAEHNATNDVAIAWPPGRAPIIIACYLAGSTVDLPARTAAHAEIGRIVAEAWG